MHAKDRLFQMVIQNRLAAGRVSEIVGGYANSSDKMYRTIGLNRAAQTSMDWFIENAAVCPEAQYALISWKAGGWHQLLHRPYDE